MARKKNPCEFCESDHYERLDGTGHHQLYIETYPDNGFIGITSFAISEATEETEELYGQIELNFCPVCVRNLSWI